MDNTINIPSAAQVEAAKELLLRRRARASLAAWARVCGFEPAAHHLLLIEKLEAVVRGEIRRLLICMPPGSAKSTYSSVLFPPWFLAQKPNSNILTASHSADLAKKFGRDARNLILTKENELGYSLRSDSQAADEWATSSGGVFFSSGVGAHIAGRRADLGLIDDPIGSREDAFSKPIRDKIWDWYVSDFRLRLKPKAAIALIQTRWHEDDLAGRLLASEGDEWHVINLPMLAKENDPLGRKVGEMLWPQHFDSVILRDAQKDRATWSAMFQQDPTPEDGDYFQRSWIEDNAYEPNELPSIDTLTLYCSSDHAVSLKEEADSTAIVLGGLDQRGVLWILSDAFWEKCDALTIVNVIIGFMKRHDIRTWWMEDEKITKSIGPFLRTAMREQNVFCHLEPVKPAKDKMTRAQSIRGRLQAGMVRFPRKATWYSAALTQMLKFPAGAHDDFIDPLAYLGLGLDKLVAGRNRVLRVDESIYRISPPITLGSLKRIERKERLLALSNDR